MLFPPNILKCLKEISLILFFNSWLLTCACGKPQVLEYGPGSTILSWPRFWPHLPFQSLVSRFHRDYEVQDLNFDLQHCFLLVRIWVNLGVGWSGRRGPFSKNFLKDIQGNELVLVIPNLESLDSWQLKFLFEFQSVLLRGHNFLQLKWHVPGCHTAQPFFPGTTALVWHISGGH